MSSPPHQTRESPSPKRRRGTATLDASPDCRGALGKRAAATAWSQLSPWVRWRTSITRELRRYSSKGSSCGAHKLREQAARAVFQPAIQRRRARRPRSPHNTSRSARDHVHGERAGADNNGRAAARQPAGAPSTMPASGASSLCLLRRARAHALDREPLNHPTRRGQFDHAPRADSLSIITLWPPNAKATALPRTRPEEKPAARKIQTIEASSANSFRSADDAGEAQAEEPERQG